MSKRPAPDTQEDEPNVHRVKGCDLSKCSTRKRIAIYGTSADPITDAHLKCCAEICHMSKRCGVQPHESSPRNCASSTYRACAPLRTELADEVWIVPCGERPDKPSLKTPYLHRLIMCHLAVNTAFGSRFPIFVCDEEMHERAALSSIVLMRKLKRKHPEKEFWFVVGADLIESLPSWNLPGEPMSGQNFYETQKFLVLARPGYELPEVPSNFVKVVKIGPPGVNVK